MFHVQQLNFLETFVVTENERLVVANLFGHRPLVPSADSQNSKSVFLGLRTHNLIFKEHFVD
jgi:hypothetical protein